MEEEEADFAAAPNQVKSDAPIIEELPSGNNEKAVVLFKPVNSPLFFSFRSELIPGFKASLGLGHRWRFRNLRTRRRWEQQQWRLKKGAEKDKGWLTGAAEECGRVMKGFLSGSSSIV
ncbi:hypothetical protein C1H46_005863 [Malus baccata]|uniref:Uncharacterized protein n=1 Tax=Malus baccata TaxID=106549 RepID=A0A540NBY1_MALBA|nr:hypothetical protein C1H46_005863 [Malus baccata]